MLFLIQVGRRLCICISASAHPVANTCYHSQQTYVPVPETNEYIRNEHCALRVASAPVKLHQMERSTKCTVHLPAPATGGAKNDTTTQQETRTHDASGAGAEPPSPEEKKEDETRQPAEVNCGQEEHATDNNTAAAEANTQSTSFDTPSPTRDTPSPTRDTHAREGGDDGDAAAPAAAPAAAGANTQQEQKQEQQRSTPQTPSPLHSRDQDDDQNMFKQLLEGDDTFLQNMGFFTDRSLGGVPSLSQLQAIMNSAANAPGGMDTPRSQLIQQAYLPLQLPHPPPPPPPPQQQQQQHASLAAFVSGAAAAAAANVAQMVGSSPPTIPPPPQTMADASSSRKRKAMSSPSTAAGGAIGIAAGAGAGEGAPPPRSSRFRGVTRHKRSGRWEAHLWCRETGKQIYLGGFDQEEHAAEAFDVAAIKCKGREKAKINFPISKYSELLSFMDSITLEELVMAVRRQSQGFARGSSRFRGVTRHPNGRWEARIGLPGSQHVYLGLFSNESDAAKAYDRALVRLRGPQAATNFALSDYRGELADYHANMQQQILSAAEIQRQHAAATGDGGGNEGTTDVAATGEDGGTAAPAAAAAAAAAGTAATAMAEPTVPGPGPAMAVLATRAREMVGQGDQKEG